MSCAHGVNSISPSLRPRFFILYTEKNKIYFDVSSRAASGGAARGGASFRSADAAQVCSNFGFVAVDSQFECSVAIAARHIVSEGW